MFRGLYVFLLLTAVAATSGAGENAVDAAGVRSDVTGTKMLIIPPVVNERFEYYEVCGICEKDLQCDLKQKCIKWSDGKKYDSVTDWKLKWDYGRSRESRSCSAGSFTVTVDIVYHIPQWSHTDDAPRPLVEKWGHYMENLMTHEKGHRDRAVESARELTRDVADLPPAHTCKELDRIVHELSRVQMSKLIKEQKAYDAATSHGAAQGAVFP